MGADFCYAVVPQFELTPEREVLLRGVLDNVPNGVLIECIQSWGLESHVPEVDLEPPEGASTTDWLVEVGDKVREYFVRCVKAVQESCFSREVCELYLPGLQYRCLITGGMSWGDSPTDAYDDFNACGMLEDVWQLLLEFAREDYAKIGQTNTSDL